MPSGYCWAYGIGSLAVNNVDKKLQAEASALAATCDSTGITMKRVLKLCTGLQIPYQLCSNLSEVQSHSRHTMILL